MWYGAWLVAAVAAARILSDEANLDLIHTALPGGLLLVFLYWQVVPLLMAATGSALEMHKLKAYPIPVRQLFAIEVLLRRDSRHRDVHGPVGRRRGHSL